MGIGMVKKDAPDLCLGFFKYSVPYPQKDIPSPIPFLPRRDLRDRSLIHVPDAIHCLEHVRLRCTVILEVVQLLLFQTSEVEPGVVIPPVLGNFVFVLETPFGHDRRFSGRPSAMLLFKLGVGRMEGSGSGSRQAIQNELAFQERK
jgi:hypothetical protein